MHEFFQICFLQTVASNIRSSSSEEEEEEEEELSLDRILCAGGDALATAVFLVAVETKRKGNADLVDNFAELFGWRVAGETFGTQ
ncbi:hypothetical protein CY35_08G001700 [Sphagnum magellanicum]|nr:hypothetical protein CY35_08G001700 [Sphagnum magellanicum]